MTARFHLVAAVLGLAAATVAAGDASAKANVHKTATIHKIAIHKTVIHKTAIVHAPHRIIGKRFVRHVPLVRRAPIVVKVVRPAIPATAVRLVKRPLIVNKRPLLHKQVLAHRVIVRKTIIR